MRMQKMTALGKNVTDLKNELRKPLPNEDQSLIQFVDSVIVEIYKPYFEIKNDWIAQSDMPKSLIPV